MGCCAGPESQADEGALLSQLCSVLKDYEGLEEIDKMLGIPTLAGQVRLCREEKLVCFLIWMSFHKKQTHTEFSRNKLMHLNCSGVSCAFRPLCMTRTSTLALQIHP